MTPTDTGTGNIVRVLRQVLGDEHLITCLDYTGIIAIHILHKYPGTQAIVGQSTPFLHQLHGIVVEQKTHLVFRIGGTIECATTPKVAVGTVLHLEQSVRQHSCLHIGLQIGPQSNLGAIQRRLFHHRQRAIGAFCRSGKQQFRLVGGITQEVSFKNRHGSGQFFFQ